MKGLRRKALGAIAAAIATAAAGQVRERVRVIGLLREKDGKGRIPAALARLGWVEGRNLRVEGGRASSASLSSRPTGGPTMVWRPRTRTPQVRSAFPPRC